MATAPDAPLLAVGANVGRIDPNLSRPYSNDLVFGIEARPRTGVVLRLEALGRWEKDLLGIVNQSSAEPKYTIVNVNDPGYDLEHSTDDEVLSVFSLAPSALPSRFDNVLTNPAGRTARRLGVKLTLEVRTNRLFFLLGGTAYAAEGAASNRGFLDSENDQGVIGDASLDPNSAINPSGRLFGDRAFTGKVSTVYRFPSDVTVGAIARYQDGQPFARLLIVPDLVQGPDIVRATVNGGPRFTFTATLDLRAQKSFAVAGRHVSVFADVYNLLNLAEEVEERAVTGARVPNADRVSTSARRPHRRPRRVLSRVRDRHPSRPPPAWLGSVVTVPRRSAITWAAALVLILGFRLLYGLTSELFFEDETQIFLLGLRYHATGAWPYFGADVVWTNSEIPGALQGLLVGVPLNIVPVPEAPYVLLNLISMAALAAFAWYITVRLPSLPAWLVWGWLMTLPWTLEFSTHIINPSYVLAPALVFFLGFFEAVPAFRLGKMPEPLAFALMGAATSWVLQIHMSWPLLVAHAAVAWLSGPARRRPGDGGQRSRIRGRFPGVRGLPDSDVRRLRPAGRLGPDVEQPASSLGQSLDRDQILARLFSFASYEIWRFIAPDDGKRWMWLLRHVWIVPIAVVVWLAGIWQPIWMLREWFRTRSPLAEWRALRMLVAGTVALVYASYWFVLEPSQAHAFYVVAPVAFMFAAYCWTFVDSPRWRRIAAVVLVLNIALHIGQAYIQAPMKSLYRNREVVAAAIRLKQPEMFAHRRPFAVAGGPAALQDPMRPYDRQRDVQLSDTQLTMRLGKVALWMITLRNSNDRVAFRDVLYRTRYLDESGRGRRRAARSDRRGLAAGSRRPDGSERRARPERRSRRRPSKCSRPKRCCRCREAAHTASGRSPGESENGATRRAWIRIIRIRDLVVFGHARPVAVGGAAEIEARLCRRRGRRGAGAVNSV